MVLSSICPYCTFCTSVFKITPRITQELSPSFKKHSIGSDWWLHGWLDGRLCWTLSCFLAENIAKWCGMWCPWSESIAMSITKPGVTIGCSLFLHGHTRVVQSICMATPTLQVVYPIVRRCRWFRSWMQNDYSIPFTAMAHVQQCVPCSFVRRLFCTII